MLIDITRGCVVDQLRLQDSRHTEVESIPARSDRVQTLPQLCAHAQGLSEKSGTPFKRQALVVIVKLLLLRN